MDQSHPFLTGLCWTLWGAPFCHPAAQALLSNMDLPLPDRRPSHSQTLLKAGVCTQSTLLHLWRICSGSIHSREYCPLYMSTRGFAPSLRHVGKHKWEREVEVKAVQLGILVPLRQTHSLSQAGHPSHASTHSRDGQCQEQGRNAHVCLRTHRAEAGGEGRVHILVSPRKSSGTAAPQQAAAALPTGLGNKKLD